MENPIVFFSYAREDAPFALRLAKELRSEGVNIGGDQLDGSGEKQGGQAGEHGPERCDVLLVVLSPASAESNDVMDEVRSALETGKRVIPLLYSECDIPFPLQQVQYIDFTAGQAIGIVALLATLRYAP